MNDEMAADEFALDLRVNYSAASAGSAGLITETPNCGAGTSRTDCETGTCKCAI
ncbi:hypothetical protein ITI46_29260 [Streptomyces oryzae]|uniref:Lantibiotic n=1 Tax=Streptomyces oryzae TaxID=1434886 RepID=A0ABS3XJX8_9ACTN|nr:hypothetical protein [Streptomyces oryzae]MBO8195708.1 hypothetical protein [Streptomyces oryzae]